MEIEGIKVRLTPQEQQATGLGRRPRLSTLQHTIFGMFSKISFAETLMQPEILEEDPTALTVLQKLNEHRELLQDMAAQILAHELDTREHSIKQ